VDAARHCASHRPGAESERPENPSGSAGRPGVDPP
jgi:hypothetical protein